MVADTLTGTPMRVLYVDDDRLNAFLFENLCAAAGEFELRCAGSGAEALACVADWRPELMIIDLHLPDTDGYALLPLLRESLDDAALPALLCTADSLDEVGRAAADAGYDGFLDKPVPLAALSTLRRHRRAA